jgi:hypothetical protein
MAHPVKMRKRLISMCPHNDPSFTISTNTRKTSHGEGKKRGVVREARANQARKKRKREKA